NFLEYASYVIKDRAIPDIDDGLKPVQRRILHTMWKMDDGKFSKVANIVGETMKLHPHGDASIGSALVVIANKEYFIEKQGNFGNLFTGDPASASRYIEARLTPLAKEVLFNPEITAFVENYDGRSQEPITLPCKIPAVLLLGAEGIAVGMSTRILPHNFNEVLDTQIALLQGGEFQLFPDFPTGGLMDVSLYEDGNGKVRVRSQIEQVDDKTLVVRDLPYGVTTESLIQSIQDATNKGKLKLTSINDFTTDTVNIELRAARGVSAEEMLKRLYAFTQCEVSISVNLLVIRKNQPELTSVTDVLKHCTDRLQTVLRRELELALEQTRLQWHRKRLEMYFIEKRIYQQFEECESYEEVQSTVSKGLFSLQSELDRLITDEDVDALLSLQIKRLSRYDRERNQKELDKLQKRIRELKHNLRTLKDYTIQYLQELKETYGVAYPRQTSLEGFDAIRKEEVAETFNIGWDHKTGFLGAEVKGNQTFTCSALDRLLIVHKDGRYRVVRVPEKLFVGKDVLAIEKVDDRVVYNLVYSSGDSQICYAKRFQVQQFILDREYRLFTRVKGAKILHLSQGPGVMLEAHYVPAPRLRKSRELLMFDTLAIKGIQARGNRVSTKPVQKVRQVTAAVAEHAQPMLPE
ncbi:MAG: DNA topoisomerase IV subunit A, partial [SAR324 cluster bacterium]|nr:DNA topoisomerase IV subunit A [SAR324 cluster bacterium]